MRTPYISAIISIVCLCCLFAQAAAKVEDKAPAEVKKAEINTPPREPVRNPYYKTRTWKLWTEDNSPITLKLPKLFPVKPEETKEASKGGEKNKKTGRKKPKSKMVLTDLTLKSPVPEKIIYPADPDPRQNTIYCIYGKTDTGKYAGISDDVYFNLDKRHSFVRDSWSDKEGNTVKGLKNSIVHATDHLYGWPPKVKEFGRVLQAYGVNFTSQSTTGIGHHITNTPSAMGWIETQFYFGNILFTGPSHISLMDRTPVQSTDLYQALVPSFYNSVGSSGSETMAITKMILAAGYMPKKTKLLLKRHGLYPSALLYMWKAALPYKVPYDHELRHRVAYNSFGDHSDYRGSNQTEVNLYYHNYHEPVHMKNMVALAKSMKIAPPIAGFKVIDVKGGHKIYDGVTVGLIQQGKKIPPVKPKNNKKKEPEKKEVLVDPNITLKISTEKSYDLQDLPLSFKWTVLHGHKNVKIEREGNTQMYTISVPLDKNLPKGRTAITLVTNNGTFDSNPAILNIYRTEGKDNRRPWLAQVPDRTILPGETVTFDLSAPDPEGYPVRFYQWDGEPGMIQGNTFTWSCPKTQAPGKKDIHIIASDHMAGNSHSSIKTSIHISPTVALISVDKEQGTGPGTVKFSSKGSRDMAKGTLTYAWDFGDGNTSTAAHPRHKFKEPGYYEVKLVVKGRSGEHAVTKVVHAAHAWKPVLNKGWKDNELDASVWKKIADNTGVEIKGRSNATYMKIYKAGKKNKTVKNNKEKPEWIGMTSVNDLKPPLYLETVYYRTRDKSTQGTGFKLFGTQFGYIENASSSAKRITIGASSKEGNKWNVHEICRKVRFPWCRTNLRMYVTQDPAEKEKLRFSGYIDTDDESSFFKFSHEQLDNVLMVRGGTGISRLEIYDLQVYSPEGVWEGPEISVQGNGLPIFKKNSEILAHNNGSDFGQIKEGPVTRTFMILNTGKSDLVLKGEPLISVTGVHAKDFEVTSMPGSVIKAQEAAAFEVTFTASGSGIRNADINIPSNDPDEDPLVFLVYGFGSNRK